MFKLDFEKAEGPETNCQHHLDYQKSKRVPEKASTSALLTMPKPLTMWIKTNCGNFFKRWEYPTTLPASWEICMQAKKRHLVSDMEQQTGSKSGKEYIKVVYCHPGYLTYMQSTSCERSCWMKNKLESRLLGEISKPQICRRHHPSGRKWRRTKEPLDESERRVKKLL